MSALSSFDPQAVLSDSIAFLAPLLPAAIGALATEMVGTLNIALEGLILVGAFSYAAVGSSLGPAAGAVAALAITAAVSYSSDLFSRKAKADSFVVGLGVNMLAPAAVSILSMSIFGTKGVAVVDGLQSARVVQGLEGVPAIGALFGHRGADYLAFGVAALIAVALGLTPFGSRAKAAGMNPESLRMAGLDAGRTRGTAFIVSGLACGTAGAALVASVGAWVPNMSSGRGWIALVAIYLGGKGLGGTLAASALFALLLSAATGAQAILAAPPELLMSIPYFATALLVIAGKSRSASRSRYKP